MTSLLDRANPLSLSSLIHDPRFDAAVANLQNKFPELLGMPERQLRKEIRRLTGVALDPDDNMIRMKFWIEYDVAMAEGRGMQIRKICAGVMGDGYFWDYLMKPTLLAWVLCPLPTYAQQLDAAVGTGMAKLLEMIELPTTDPITGKINVQLLNTQAKIIAMLDMRKHGAFTQKIEQKNVHLHASASDVQKEIQSMSMEEVEKRMKKLEASERDSAIIEAKASRPTYTVEAEVE